MSSQSPNTIREQWSSRMGFLAAAIGSAVGLGNIWRFPYQLGENGGGTFLIPYFLAILLCGVPLMIFEVAAGRQYRHGVSGTVRAIQPRVWFIGVVLVLIGFVLLSYYLVTTGWTLGYLVSTPLGLDSSFSAFSAGWNSLVYFLIAAGVSFSIVLLGVRRGIERVSKLLIPLLAATVLLMAGYALTFDGTAQALNFLFQPDFSQLLHPRVWAAGFGQAFFSLSVGQGVLLTYGSYLDDATNIPKSAATVATADTLIAFLAGLAVFPIVFTFGYSPAEGPQLAFATLPEIFQQINLGTLIGTAFYLLLFVAATTSAVSLLEMVVAALGDHTGLSHFRCGWLVLLPLLALGTLSALSYSPLEVSMLGKPFMDLLDAVVGNFALPIGALLTSIVLFWMGHPDLLVIQTGGNPRGALVRLTFYCGKYILPVALLVTLAAYVASFL